MVGNLLDNACKWAKSPRLGRAPTDADGAGNFEVLVDDDGPGLTEAGPGQGGEARAAAR